MPAHEDKQKPTEIDPNLTKGAVTPGGQVPRVIICLLKDVLLPDSDFDEQDQAFIITRIGSAVICTFTE